MIMFLGIFIETHDLGQLVGRQLSSNTQAELPGQVARFDDMLHGK